MPDPGLIYRLVQRHRRELLRQERQAATVMVSAYGEVWQRFKRDIDQLMQQIREMEAIGEAVPASWLFQFGRLESLQRQLEMELRRFVDHADAAIRDQQWEAVEAALRHSREMAAVWAGDVPGIVASFSRLPSAALTDLVGFLRDGSPLRTLLDELGPRISAGFQRELINGLAIGSNPREISRRIRREFGAGLARTLRISRTETLRAYREATLRNYQVSEVVEGWVWMAAHQDRTCAACLAMDGTIHRPDERLDDHPNGRCVAVPVVKGMPRIETETGQEWLDRQNEATQRKILGNAGYEAYKAGAVRLQDFVGQKRSPEWGTTRYARSLRQILGAEEAWKWYMLTPRHVTAPFTVQQRVQAMVARVDGPLARLTRTNSTWNGTVHVQQLRADIWGKKGWDCSITVNRDIIGTDTWLWPTINHEVLHALSSGLDRAAYRAFRGWEEGIVEKLQRILGPRVLRSIGQQSHIGLVAYDHYITELERLRTFLGRSESRFYLQLLRVPLADREQTVADMGRHLPAGRQAEWQRLLSIALPVLRKR